MIAECSLIEPVDAAQYCVIALPGRFGHGDHLAQFYADNSGMPSTMFIGITPAGFAWYPMPNNALDQKEAVAGLPAAREAIEEIVQLVEQQFSMPKDRIVLAGFSAGGVMAIEVAAHSSKPYAAVISHCGAILEPSNLPPCRHETPIILIHNADDNCFDWHERFMPMKNELIEKGYPTFSLERRMGGHCIKDVDVSQAGEFLQQHFGLKEKEDENLFIEPCVLPPF